MVAPLQAAGALVAFVFACISVATDLQDELHRVAKGPRTGTQVLGSKYAVVFVIGWGAVGVVAYCVAQGFPEWFEKAFSLKLDKNNLLTGLLIGASTVVIIRSNLITVAKMPIGGEFFYSLTRARVVFVMNKRRGAQRADFLRAQRAYADIQAYPNYFTKMEAHIALIGPPLPTFGSMTTEIASIKAASRTPDGDVGARQSLTGLMYDYFGAEEVLAWGNQDDWGR